MNLFLWDAETTVTYLEREARWQESLGLAVGYPVRDVDTELEPVSTHASGHHWWLSGAEHGSRYSRRIEFRIRCNG